ncbi:MAG: hypothetical protein TQ35_0000545 [Candidatus Aramenus sulfurataquae]|uniref:Uncharacterized protein n=3 Tax=Candidatus Aramenus sulfurataquae TaxID=1326980 RepID=A0AAE3K1G3_9CREN|nr:hypothetical protein [Candidatus Aramenus sulfurataquae]
MSPSRHSCFMESGVYNRLVEAAKKRNMSVYKYTNELVSRALDLEESGISLESVRSYALLLESLSKYKGRIAVLPFDAVLNTEVPHWEGLGRGLGLLLRQMGKTKEELVSLAASAIKFLFQFMGEVSYGDGMSISFPFLHVEMQKRLVQFAKAFVIALSSSMGLEVEVREEESGLEVKFKAP